MFYTNYDVVELFSSVLIMFKHWPHHYKYSRGGVSVYSK